MTPPTIDARGMLCPKPLIMVKKALVEMQVGTEFTVLLDNEIAKENVLRFLQDNRTAASCTAEGGIFAIQAKKLSQDLPAPGAEAYCGPSGAPGNPVFVVSRNTMGSGSEDLGRILLEAAINSLKEVTPLPSALVFYNSGVHLACEGSTVLDSLKDLQSRGVRLLVCGTCINYFDLKAGLRAGTLSNMYDILQVLSSSDHVVPL